MVMNAVCPVCGKKYSGYPSISRMDNKTPICAGCGNREALARLIEVLTNDIKEEKKDGNV